MTMFWFWLLWFLKQIDNFYFRTVFVCFIILILGILLDLKAVSWRLALLCGSHLNIELHFLFIIKMLISFVLDMLAIFLKTSSERYCQCAFIRTHLRAPKQKLLNICIKKIYILFKKKTTFGCSLNFNFPTKMLLELTGVHFSSSEHIHWQHMGIFTSLHFSGQRLMNWLRCISVTSKILSLKSQFENIPKKSRIRETLNLSTDADNSTDAIGGWSKNTPKPDFFEKRKKSSKTNLNITASYQYNRLISQYNRLMSLYNRLTETGPQNQQKKKN